jgi:AhpD family alkylhydroperoxidase
VVSSVNACGYCLGAHARTAEAFGVDPALIEALAADLDTAPVEPKLKPVLAYVTKLTRTPSRMTDADRQAVFDAGWDLAAPRSHPIRPPVWLQRPTPWMRRLWRPACLEDGCSGPSIAPRHDQSGDAAAQGVLG